MPLCSKLPLPRDLLLHCELFRDHRIETGQDFLRAPGVFFCCGPARDQLHD
jgi:hypothetical protein